MRFSLFCLLFSLFFALFLSFSLFFTPPQTEGVLFGTAHQPHLTLSLVIRRVARNFIYTFDFPHNEKLLRAHSLSLSLSLSLRITHKRCKA